MTSSEQESTSGSPEPRQKIIWIEKEISREKTDRGYTLVLKVDKNGFKSVYKDYVQF